MTFGLTDDLTIDAMESQEWAAFFMVVLTANKREIQGRSTIFLPLAKTPRGKGATEASSVRNGFSKSRISEIRFTTIAV